MSGASSSLAAPAPLADDHDLEPFSCGIPSLDDWLKRRARAHHAGGASRSYVIASENRVVGYYCLSSGAIAAVEAPGKIKRNMPDPIPMAVLARLVTSQAAHILGVRGVLVHAISDEAKAFYEHHGFVVSPSNPMTLILSLQGIRTA